VSLQVASYPFRQSFYLKRHDSTKHGKTYRKFQGNSGEAFWNNWKVTRPATRGMEPGNCPHFRDFALKMCSVLHVRDFRKWFLNYDATEKRHKYNGWWNLHACLRQPTTEIKADIDFITKNKKQKVVLLFYWCVVHLFSSRKSLSRKQTNKQKT